MYTLSSGLGIGSGLQFIYRLLPSSKNRLYMHLVNTHTAIEIRTEGGGCSWVHLCSSCE